MPTAGKPAATASRPTIDGRTIGLGLAALAPAFFTFWLAFHDGGYFPSSVSLVAVELAVLLALRFTLARTPWEGISVPLALAAGFLGALAFWTLHSQGWSHAPARAIAEYDRVLLYLLTLAFFGSLAFSVRRVRLMLYGVAIAVVAICGAAFIVRTLPEVIAYSPPIHAERLSYPLTYWNSLGLLSAVGLILTGHLACSTRDPRPLRVLGAAAVPLLAATLYYTFSRGATWLALAGVVIYVVLGRPRGLLSGAIATVPSTVIALATVNPAGVLTRDPLSAATIDSGQRIALTVGLCVAGAAVLRALLLPLDGWADRVRLPERARRPILAGATAGAVVVGLAGCAALQGPSFVADKYDEFNTSERTAPHTGLSRLTTASSSGRRAHWDVAKAVYRDHSGRGTGAGTWAIEWNKRRKNQLAAQDAHSLYLETRSDLGLPGLLMLVPGLLLILGAFLFRARGPDRALFAALFAAGFAWAVHAGIDWDWEMPAITLWLFAFGGMALARTRQSAAPGWKVAVPVKVALVAACAAVAVLPMRMAVSEARVDESLDAVADDRCRMAKAKAWDALEALGERALPYQVIGFCELRLRRPPAAARAYRRAVDRDPANWELRRDLAVALGRSGRDPRRNAELAARLNPRDVELQELAAAFRAGAGKRAWRRVAVGLTIHPPGPPTP